MSDEDADGLSWQERAQAHYDHEPHKAEYGLVMPFVVTQSNGGDYEDNAYAAGWEAGRCDELLATCARLNKPTVDVPIARTGNLHQLDLVGMRYGYSMRIEHNDGFWASVVFEQRAGGAAAGTPEETQP